MSAVTIKTDHEAREYVDFTDYTTRGLVECTVELLREGDLILRDGDTDYAAADLLEVLGAMHDETGIDIERLPQVRAFCITVLDGAGWVE
jgi:hypothetical protein